jgi:riboflavin kinase / FMN adenylyltransferase
MPSTCKIFQSTKDAKDFCKQGTAITIGNYDGVHHGHQIIIKNLIKKAKKLGVKSVLLTFDPHPVKILAKHVAPKLIHTKEQKIECLSKLGLDAVVIQSFNTAFARHTAEEFFSKHLVKALNARFISVGHDFTFGDKRSGTIETLEILAYPQKIEIEVIEAQMIQNTLVSSSLIRKMIHQGNMKVANDLLTRDFYIDGTVIQGHQRGTALGIHTANLESPNELIPEDGVYATRISINGKVYDSVTNIGFNPTFDNKNRSIEAHIFDFSDNIYDQDVRLFFIDKIRKEIKFATPTALVKQIGKDIESAKSILKKG